MRLYVMLACRHAPRSANPALAEAFDRLERCGFQVDIGVAEQLIVRPELLEPDADLYVLKSHAGWWLRVAGILHAQGARLLNPYPSCVATQDKIGVSWRLRAAGIPTPRSWVTGDLRLLDGIARDAPLIVKPTAHHQGHGTYVVSSPADLAALPMPRRPVYVQEYVPGNNEDLKVYVVGERVAAVRKPSALSRLRGTGTPCPVTPELHELALRCGRALGLGLYGLDVLESRDGPVVVDVNYFPSYGGVPDAASLLAEYIAAYASGDGPELKMEVAEAAPSVLDFDAELLEHQSPGEAPPAGT